MDIISSKSIKFILNLPYSINNNKTRKIRESQFLNDQTFKIISNNVIFKEKSEEFDNEIIISQPILIQSNLSLMNSNETNNFVQLTTINYEDYGVGNELSLNDITTGCEQYFSMGKFIPYENLEFLSKIIFQVESFEKVLNFFFLYLNKYLKLFELKTFQELCELDKLIDSISNSNKFITKLPFSFNLPNYAVCLNANLKNCSQLNQERYFFKNF